MTLETRNARQTSQTQITPGRSHDRYTFIEDEKTMNGYTFFYKIIILILIIAGIYVAIDSGATNETDLINYFKRIGINISNWKN